MQFPILISLKPVVLNLNVESPGGIFKNADAQESFSSQGWEALPNHLCQAQAPGTSTADPATFHLSNHQLTQAFYFPLCTAEKVRNVLGIF